jgi:hypothetical protein
VPARRRGTGSSVTATPLSELRARWVHAYCPCLCLSVVGGRAS